MVPPYLKSSLAVKKIHAGAFPTMAFGMILRICKAHLFQGLHHLSQTAGACGTNASFGKRKVLGNFTVSRAWFFIE
jgi:hypothetical protein